MKTSEKTFRYFLTTTYRWDVFSFGTRNSHTGVDSDDNGQLDISDAIVHLQYLFNAGKPPPDPLGSVDATARLTS